MLPAYRNFIHVLLLNEIEEVNERNPRGYDDRKDPYSLSDTAFLQLFRLTKELTNYLIDVLTPFLTDQRRETDLDIKTKVLIALRFYASGSYQMDIGSNKFFCVTQAYVSRCLREITNALNNPEVFGRFVIFPSTLQELNNVRTRFYQQYNFPGIVGIIDCTHIAIVPPARNDPEHPEHIYVNRKYYHSLNVQLICDEKLKIMNVNASFPGSTHDTFILNASAASRALTNLHQAGYEGYYLLDDSGYPLRPWLMVPIEGNPPQRSPEGMYNSRFRSIRSLIERCNGVLKKRFRCLLKHRVLNYTPAVAGQIVNACTVLHNLCIDHNVQEPADNDLPEHPDFGMYQNAPLPVNIDHVARRVNPDLAAGRILQRKIIANIN